jgi:hypothetical protein
MNFVLDSICNQINEEHVSLESIFKDIDGNPLTRGMVNLSGQLDNSFIYIFRP